MIWRQSIKTISYSFRTTPSLTREDIRSKEGLFVFDRFDRLIWRLFAHSVSPSVHTSDYLIATKKLGAILKEKISKFREVHFLREENLHVEILVNKAQLRRVTNGLFTNADNRSKQTLLLGVGTRWFLSVPHFRKIRCWFHLKTPMEKIQPKHIFYRASLLNQLLFPFPSYTLRRKLSDSTRRLLAQFTGPGIH